LVEERTTAYADNYPVFCIGVIIFLHGGCSESHPNISGNLLTLRLTVASGGG
jgi:hypothetical protein